MSATNLAAVLSAFAMGILIGATGAAVWATRALPVLAFFLAAFLIWLVYTAFLGIRAAGRPRIPTDVRRPADDLQ